jgi:hypothetical protein
MVMLISIIMPPPPMPWIARDTTSMTMVWEAPHSAEPMRKMTMDA